MHSFGRLMRTVAAILALVVACWASFGALHAQTNSDGDKVKRLLDATGLKYNTHNATTWSVDYDSDKLGKTKVVISVGKDIVVTFVIVAKKTGIQKTPQLADTLLTANHEYDYTKVGLDSDGDLFVRIDTPLRLVDAPQLKDNINQTFRASEELFGKVAPFVKR
jgi:Putative bacterial sensory transduction regulator